MGEQMVGLLDCVRRVIIYEATHTYALLKHVRSARAGKETVRDPTVAAKQRVFAVMFN